MQTVHCEGILAHHFWGDYCATVALLFKSAQHAADAKVTLGDKWQVGKKDTALVWNGNSNELAKLTDQLASYGADPKKIASVAKSIDYGEPFECDVPIVPVEQGSLF